MDQTNDIWQNDANISSRACRMSQNEQNKNEVFNNAIRLSHDAISVSHDVISVSHADVGICKGR